jgi:hypothetical protein
VGATQTPKPRCAAVFASVERMLDLMQLLE